MFGVCVCVLYVIYIFFYFCCCCCCLFFFFSYCRFGVVAVLYLFVAVNIFSILFFTFRTFMCAQHTPHISHKPFSNRNIRFTVLSIRVMYDGHWRVFSNVWTHYILMGVANGNIVCAVCSAVAAFVRMRRHDFGCSCLEIVEFSIVSLFELLTSFTECEERCALCICFCVCLRNIWKKTELFNNFVYSARECVVGKNGKTQWILACGFFVSFERN